MRYRTMVRGDSPSAALPAQKASGAAARPMAVESVLIRSFAPYARPPHSGAGSVAGLGGESVAAAATCGQPASGPCSGSDAHAFGPSGSDAHVRAPAESDARYRGESDARGVSRLLGLRPPEVRLRTRCGTSLSRPHNMLWGGEEDWRARRDSNPRPADPKSAALSTELRARICAQRERKTRYLPVCLHSRRRRWLTRRRRRSW